MYFKRFPILVFILFCNLILFGNYAHADKPLKSALGLNTEQAAKVAKIQKQARDAIRKPRGELHTKERALRRAKVANDSKLIAKLESQIPPLQAKLKQIHDEEERSIRAVLTPDQTSKYEMWLEERNNMVGSSRDVKEYR